MGQSEEDRLARCCRSERAHNGQETTIKKDDPVSSFPYYPSLQERHIFKYIFVDTESSMDNLKTFGSSLYKCARVFINTFSILYNLFEKAEVLDPFVWLHISRTPRTDLVKGNGLTADRSLVTCCLGNGD